MVFRTFLFFVASASLTGEPGTVGEKGRDFDSGMMFCIASISNCHDGSLAEVRVFVNLDCMQHKKPNCQPVDYVI